MAPTIPDATLDLILTELATADRLCLCSQEPTTYTEAVTTYKVAIHTLTPGDGNGDFTIANDTSGRKLTLSEQTPVTLDSTDAITHLALCDTSSSGSLLWVTALTSSLDPSYPGTVTVPELKVCNVKDPTTS
jgi:hypothetical protein